MWKFPAAWKLSIEFSTLQTMQIRRSNQVRCKQATCTFSVGVEVWSICSTGTRTLRIINRWEIKSSSTSSHDQYWQEFAKGEKNKHGVNRTAPSRCPVALGPQRGFFADVEILCLCCRWWTCTGWRMDAELVCCSCCCSSQRLVRGNLEISRVTCRY